MKKTLWHWVLEWVKKTIATTTTTIKNTSAATGTNNILALSHNTEWYTNKPSLFHLLLFLFIFGTTHQSAGSRGYDCLESNPSGHCITIVIIVIQAPVCVSCYSWQGNMMWKQEQTIQRVLHRCHFLMRLIVLQVSHCDEMKNWHCGPKHTQHNVEKYFGVEGNRSVCSIYVFRHLAVPQMFASIMVID